MKEKNPKKKKTSPQYFELVGCPITGHREEIHATRSVYHPKVYRTKLKK